MLLHMDDRLSAGASLWTQSDPFVGRRSQGGGCSGTRAGTPGEFVPVNPGGGVGAPRQVERDTLGREGGPCAVDAFGAPGPFASDDGPVRSQNSVGVGKIVADRSCTRHRTCGTDRAHHGR
jgi:hypothetical protein